MASTKKILKRTELEEVISSLHAENKITGFTSGAFDILHAGHVDYLEKARAECDCLIVAVNSDNSIRQYKNDKRPVVNQTSRARVIAGLGCVDYVFIFDELNNNKNIGSLKPKIYFKAGDYSKDKLTSASLVESYGGKVRLIDVTPGCSTTKVIEEILFKFSPSFTDEIKVQPKSRRPAVFFDRDGTINVHIDYLHEVEKFRMLPGAAKAMKKLQDAGYYLIIVTNQPGIGLGYFTREDLFNINKEMMKALTQEGVSLDKIYFCPHSKAEGCNCRKPETGMIDRALKELDIDLKNSYVIGDMSSDVLLGNKAGCKSILLRTGHGGDDKLFEAKPDYIAEDLMQAANFILGSAS